MIPKPIDQIEADDLQALLSNAVVEGKTLEYKRDLPGHTDADKKEFLADVSSFANSAGGDLVLGVDEQSGVPTAILGIASQDADAEVRRLDQILLSGIQPRMLYRIRSVSCPSGTVLLVRAEESWNGPHRVVFKGHDRFYARTSAGKYALDVDELRQAFLQSEKTRDRIRLFREDRLLDIARGITPVPLTPGARLVLHFLPRQAFASPTLVDASSYSDHADSLPPMGRGGWNHRITFHGVATFTPGQQGAYGYVHLHRNGVLEAVDAYIVNREHEGQRVIPSVAFEERVVTAAQRYMRVFRDLQVAPPLYFFLSLMGVKGCRLGASASQAQLSGHPSIWCNWARRARAGQDDRD